MKVTHIVLQLILCVGFMLGVGGTVYFYMLSNDLTEQLEHMEKLHTIQLNAVKDTPYPSTDYYIEQLDKLQAENTQLKKELEQLNK